MQQDIGKNIKSFHKAICYFWNFAYHQLLFSINFRWDDVRINKSQRVKCQNFNLLHMWLHEHISIPFGFFTNPILHTNFQYKILRLWSIWTKKLIEIYWDSNMKFGYKWWLTCIWPWLVYDLDLKTYSLTLTIKSFCRDCVSLSRRL